ncbi:MAG: sulfotransferase [Roseinatronobacter sp.]|nr:sulfotransferase [Roseinatronobacter sp.]
MAPTQRENCADILCIGAQKASTSWLHHVVNAHPRTYAFPDSEPTTSTVKEAHFWDWNHARGEEWYRTLLAPPQPEMLSMDFTPEYALMSDEQIAECKRLSPKARVIYVLRDPLARAISALRMYTLWRKGGAGAEDVEIGLGEEFLALMREAKIAEMSSYMANYQRWANHYPDTLVLNYEDIVATPEAVIARVFAHCGLEIDTMPPDARAKFDARMQKRVWASVPYPVKSDLLYFLHGFLWPKRQAAERFFKLRFTEYQGFLDAAR